ncbi:hypothetical protein LSH36_2887g00000 [Paralvinella palmiformis]|uniref:Methionine--tRNA ligase, mitochondrial n=1 Tax=Paralvinella palmiformis TaxID=53620 RepID=A0AAD9IPV4_9ANNE|nr:hypothetical protein LSH36_2887g00000 [Paralvinella palmiformis]
MYWWWLVSSGGRAVNHRALGAKGHRFDPSKRSKLFKGLISRLTTSRLRFVDDRYAEYNIYKGIDAVMNQLRLTNTFVEQQKPWELCKHNERARQLGNVLHLTMETLRVCAILLQPL